MLQQTISATSSQYAEPRKPHTTLPTDLINGLVEDVLRADVDLGDDDERGQLQCHRQAKVLTRCAGHAVIRSDR
mgnify:CR=1 FL=1